MALTVDPRNVESLVNLALVQKAAGRPAKHAIFCMRALAIDPRHPGSHYNLAVVADEAGDVATAVSHYRSFVKLGAVTHGELAAQVRARLALLDAPTSLVLAAHTRPFTLAHILNKMADRIDRRSASSTFTQRRPGSCPLNREPPGKARRKSRSIGRKRTTSFLRHSSSGRRTWSIAAVLERFKEEHFPECFREYADLLDWDQYWHTTLDTSDPPFWKWFVGGTLNACYNCVDRHLAKYKNKAALIFVPEPEDEPAHTVTYQELFTRVNEVAAVLRDFCGLKAGDRVTIHMPMIPELPITMLACARLGVIHSVVFGGFSGEAAGLRAADSGSRVMIYADGYYRNGKIVDHKPSADIAVEAAAEGRPDGREGPGVAALPGPESLDRSRWCRGATTSWTRS